MNGFEFTERTRKVINMSREEARALHHEYVGTEHLLLALIRDGGGVGVAALRDLGVNLDEVTRLINETVKTGISSPGAPDLPFTSRAKKTLELAMAEAADLKHSYVSTEHLLLGLLREEKGIAAQTLVHVGASLDKTRAQVLKLLGTSESVGAAGEPSEQKRHPVSGGATMTGYNFTERVRKCLAMAREDAAALHHQYVGTEHLLLGLIREGEGVAAAVLQNLNVDLDDLERLVKKQIEGGESARSTGPDLPYTSRAKKTLELSMAQARDFNHAYVGTEHLLLGLLREEKGIAAQALAQVGVTLDAVQAETLRLLGTPEAEVNAARKHAAELREAGATSKFIAPVASISVQIHLENGHVVREQFRSVIEAIAYLTARAKG
jgi:ATP-dependent Clp protease ATP-binding subunit ClpA